MDVLVARIDSWWLALFFGLAMFGGLYLGWRRGNRTTQDRGEKPGDKLTDASIALLGLLLAFTFSMALNRYEQRRQALVAEATAISDFYTSATLLKEPHRIKLQSVIRKFALDQMDTRPGMLQTVEERDVLHRSQQEVNEMTAIVEQAINDGTPLVVPLTATFNSMTTAVSARIAVFETPLPAAILLLLFLAAALPSYLIGERQGATHFMYLTGSMTFILLVTLVVFVIIDLNQPHRGLIQLPRITLPRVIDSMGPG